MVYLENINLNKKTINIWCNSEKKYHLFLSKSQLPKVFYFKNQTIVSLELFNLDTVSLKNWTPDQHYLFEKMLRKHSQITYQDNSQKWLEISKDVPNTSPKECLQHYQFIKQQLQENRKKKEQAITLEQPIYQTQFQDKNENINLYLIDIIFPTMIEINPRAKIILYNFDSLLLDYKIPVEKIYVRIHQLVTKQHLNIDNIWFASENFETLFNLDDFAILYQQHFDLDKHIIKEKLWGDHYYSSEKKWITQSEKIPRAFCQYVLNPILQLHDAVTNKKVKKIDKMLTKLNIAPEDKFNFDCVFSTWFNFQKKCKHILYMTQNNAITGSNISYSWEYIKYSYFFSGAGGVDDYICNKWKIMLANNSLNKKIGQVRFGDDEDADYLRDSDLSEEDSQIIISKEELDQLINLILSWPKNLNTFQLAGPGCNITEKMIIGGKNGFELGFDADSKQKLTTWCQKNSLILN